MENFEKPYRLVSSWTATARFVFMPRSFLRQAVKHDIAMSFARQPDVRRHYQSDPVLLSKYEAEILEANSARMNAVRHALFSTMCLVGLSALDGLLCGWVFSHLFGNLPPSGNTALQVLGAAILLWAAIWQLGSDQQTGAGETLVERVHSWLFRALCVFGTVLLFIAYGSSL